MMFGQRGHRYIYYATGLPGWMRFGYSPGWGFMPPGAQFLTTGSWPSAQANAFWQNYQQSGNFVPFGPGVSSQAELSYLKQQAENLKAQLSAIEKRIEDLEKE